MERNRDIRGGNARSEGSSDDRFLDANERPVESRRFASILRQMFAEWKFVGESYVGIVTGLFRWLNWNDRNTFGGLYLFEEVLHIILKKL